jgi:hypothetical protein
VPGVVLPRTNLVADLKVEEVKPDEKIIVPEVPLVKGKPREIRHTDYSKPAVSKTPKPVEKPVEQIIDTTKKEPVIAPIKPVTTPAVPEKCCKLWYLWLLLGLGIIFFLIILRRKRKKDKES